MITLTLPITDEEKTQLGGESERNFVRLEQAMKVRLLTRNPGIGVQAEDEAVARRACVALEAMEGTDAMLSRAAGLADGKPLRLVKVSRRRRHLQFDVPVAGPLTIAAMKQSGATALAVDAGRTLLLDRAEMI